MKLPSKGVVVFFTALTGIAVYRAQRPGAMTPERDRLYRQALNGHIRDSAELRRIADQFQGWRLFPQAQLLRQRADLRDLPPEAKAHRRAIFRKGMNSKNKLAVLKLADAFDSQGATIAADRLRKYASGLPDLDHRSFVENEAIVTPPSREDAPDDAGAEGGDEPPDTEPAPDGEKPIPAPAGDSRPETPPGPNPDLKHLNGAASHAAA